MTLYCVRVGKIACYRLVSLRSTRILLSINERTNVLFTLVTICDVTKSLFYSPLLFSNNPNFKNEVGIDRFKD